METYRVKPGDRAIYPDGTVHTFIEIGVDLMAEPKKKPFKKSEVDEFLFTLRDRADAQYRLIDELRRKVNTDEQSMARIVDRLHTLESASTCTKSLREQQFDDYENRIRKLEQRHCCHDFEIVGGCVSVTNRFAGCYSGSRVKPRTVKVKCVHCGLTVDQPFDVAEEPKKLHWFKRFVNYCFPFTSPWSD